MPRAVDPAAGGGPRENAAGAPRHVVLIPAAGSGTRLGGRVPKQYLELCGRTVLECTVAAFLAHDWFDHVAVVVQPDDNIAARLAGLRVERVGLIRRGGQSRRDTVLNGLTYLAQKGLIDQHDWVYVHDAARPGIDAASLLRLSARLEHETCGALLCMPMADTVKRVDPVASLEARPNTAAAARWTAAVCGWRRRRRCSGRAPCGAPCRPIPP